MVFLILSIAVILSLFAYYEESIRDKYKTYILISLGLALVLMAGFKDVYSVKDAANYEYFYQNYDDPILMKGLEFSYVLISLLLHHITKNAIAIFLFYASIGVGLKFVAIKKLSPSLLFLPLLAYLSNFYMLHELTQIRAGVASGCSLLVIYHSLNNKWQKALPWALIAICFHYSAVVLLVIPLLKRTYLKAKIRYILLGLIPFGYLMHFIGIDIATVLSAMPIIGSKILVYKELQEMGIAGDEINVFNLLFLIKLAITFYIAYYYDVIHLNNKSITLFFEMELISILSFLMFSSFPVVAFRISELFGVAEIFLIPMLSYTIKQEKFGKLLSIMVSLGILVLNIFYLKLVK